MHPVIVPDTQPDASPAPLDTCASGEHAADEPCECHRRDAAGPSELLLAVARAYLLAAAHSPDERELEALFDRIRVREGFSAVEVLGRDDLADVEAT